MRDAAIVQFRGSPETLSAPELPETYLTEV
jgi:hypothetical protein